ncbi:hypothetical protein [Evansella tamaricis]|uniref:Uncharacterized protein n=1 Tax=Evansella tamaricis TaxID=2069301 RepID=A0ABS6JPI2_9BACI|nr:hypothetical protein [Evansella tamaricis]MBU9714712.1 hypothetical protein [Evansella tamaricis]
MENTLQHDTIYNNVLLLVIEVLVQYEQKELPSPTLKDLSSLIGYSEEIILESMELGNVEPESIIQ